MTLPFTFVLSLNILFLLSFGVLAQEQATDEKAATPKFATKTFATQPGVPIEINADHMEFLMEGNRLIAKDHVVIIHGTMTLTADMVEFSRDTKVAIAEGHVVLTSPEGTISGDKLIFNFEKKTGEFKEATLFSAPYYGFGKTASKISDKRINVKDGYITSCDLDKPHYRLKSNKVDIYPKDKVVARKVRMYVGKIPLFYLPKLTQALDGKPKVIYTPGFDKKWGMYLLTSWRYYFNENFQGWLHFDAREKKDIASGVDLSYKTKNIGSGIIRTYYMNERRITSKRFYQERPSPTIEKERFRVEWRHKWAIDPNTDATLQYSRYSDRDIVKEYFKREYEKDSSPQTFFLLTKVLRNATFSFRTDGRVNRYESIVERLPEVRYDLTSQKIGETRFYVRSQNGFANLSKKNASPTEVRKETIRFDSDNEISYPLKVSFIELKPFVGGRQTYYSKTINPSEYNIIRGLFRTGADLSTKFYKVLDLKGKFWGMEINRLRHIITPSVAYEYIHPPTVLPTQLDTFDGVDSLDKRHNIGLSLENKLQMKRKDKSVDLVRFVLGSDFRLKENPSKGGFSNVTSKLELTPTDKVKFLLDSSYDSKDHRLTSVNFDFYLNNEDDKWFFYFSKRFSPEVDDQITTALGYIINPKWKFKIYRRFDIAHGLIKGSVKKQEFTLTRDMHCWEMDINFNETRGIGSEIWLVFRLKAFPDLTFDFGSSFNKRKVGSQVGQ